MPKGPRKRDLTFYLLKTEVGSLDDAISDPGQLEVFDLADAVPFEARLYVRPSHQTPPWWAGFLAQGVGPLAGLFNANCSAALVLAAAGRRFALTFGYGRNLLVLDAFVREFGLRCALNTVDPQTLRSVDARTFEELSVMTRSQTSRATGLENFRISQAQDILRAVSGQPRDKDFGSRITGADAAKVTYVPVLSDLSAKCEALLAAYESEAYKARFAFIDQLRAVRDPVVVELLNNDVVRRLRERDYGSLHLAPPDVVETQEIDGFVFGGLEEEPSTDLDVTHYRDLLGDDAPLSVAEIRRQKVGVVYSSGAEPHYRWKLFDCIVAEIPEGESLYVLSAGMWYQVEPAFAAGIGDQVQARVTSAETLPHAGGTETEPSYNQRAAASSGMHLLDGRLVTPSGAQTPIEFCDLMSSERRLIHLKRRSRSSTLSHLFSQGVVSAETFLRDRTFRLALAKRLADDGLGQAASLIPDERPEPRDWEVVFGIIGGAAKGWPRSLPFFTQLNFKIQADRLQDLGYRVYLAHVPVQ
jgi:uncharacterized protein (TIGR04141 family)